MSDIFLLVTNHKPFLRIFSSKKGTLHDTVNRLKRLLTIILNYGFRIKYQSTNKIGQADAFSKLMDIFSQRTGRNSYCLIINKTGNHNNF